MSYEKESFRDQISSMVLIFWYITMVFPSLVYLRRMFSFIDNDVMLNSCIKVVNHRYENTSKGYVSETWTGGLMYSHAYLSLFAIRVYICIYIYIIYILWERFKTLAHRARVNIGQLEMVLKPECSENLMPWVHQSPGHRQPWQWSCRIIVS